jgi:hypothetical protein
MRDKLWHKPADRTRVRKSPARFHMNAAYAQSSRIDFVATNTCSAVPLIVPFAHAWNTVT